MILLDLINFVFLGLDEMSSKQIALPTTLLLLTSIAIEADILVDSIIFNIELDRIMIMLEFYPVY